MSLPGWRTRDELPRARLVSTLSVSFRAAATTRKGYSRHFTKILQRLVPAAAAPAVVSAPVAAAAVTGVPVDRLDPQLAPRRNARNWARRDAAVAVISGWGAFRLGETPVVAFRVARHPDRRRRDDHSGDDSGGRRGSLGRRSVAPVHHRGGRQRTARGPVVVEDVRHDDRRASEGRRTDPERSN